ncbi:MAG TPA: biotin/lipoyl-containing protein, partial [Rhizomicrobium sp.]|nr:biotin/lipoyl-containing protein [Rhizomicrobium sp.]
MGRYVFKLPDVGEGTAEAEIVAWHVKVGDEIHEDQNLVDVMTDKATVEMTSPVSGKVISLHGEPGEMAAVGAALVELEIEGEGNVKSNGHDRAKAEAKAETRKSEKKIQKDSLSPTGGEGQGLSRRSSEGAKPDEGVSKPAHASSPPHPGP